MKTSDFDYSLPAEFIAQIPVEPRDNARLMVVNRDDGSIEHRHFYNITDYLHDGDVMVLNESRVIPARLFGRKTDTEGKVEILLLKELEDESWEALVKPGKRIGVGTAFYITDKVGKKTGATGKILARAENGLRTVRFSSNVLLSGLGKIPLPPYIHVPLERPERYQTVYASKEGSVAAPTAGLHFTPELINDLKNKGIIFAPVTLHIGLDTFRPVQEESPEEHQIHAEFGEISSASAVRISSAKAEGRRVICVGTTSVRITENAAVLSSANKIKAFTGLVRNYILPGFRFMVTDAMITNFHLPRSTLIMLVSAFCGNDLIKKAYQEAISERYRFYSFGDAMLIL